MNKIFRFGISAAITLTALAPAGTTLAALTFGATSVASDGALTITGTSASAWNLGGQTLSLQTTGNGAITTGTGTFTFGGNLVASAGTLTLAQSTTNAVIIGDVSGNARGSYGVDIQTLRGANDQVASGTYSVAIGTRAKASGTYSIAMSYEAQGTGAYDIAMGYSSSATGGGAIAMGYDSSADGGYGVAIGATNSASGTYGSTLGYSNVANSAYTTALGYDNTSSNNYALTLGYTNTASASGAIAIGNNITNATGDSLMIGPSNTAKLTILSTGFTGILNSSPQSALHVGTTNSASWQYVQIDSENGAPAGGDCDADAERGRMVHDYTNFVLYVCGGASRGWDTVSLTN